MLDYDPYDIVEKEFEKYTGQDEIILMSDFNAKLSIVQDVLSNHGVKHVPVPDISMFDCNFI